MQKISTHLWYDKEAREAAELYTKVFPDAKIKYSSNLKNTPSGDVDMLTIELAGQEFSLISAGPIFKFTPAISFMVSLSSKEQIERIWSQLMEGGGFAMMELGEYPFSEKFGWLADKFGLSWQLMYSEERNIKQTIVPTMMFVGDVSGRAEEAMNFYTSIFPNSKTGAVIRYESGEEPEVPNTIKHGTFTLDGQEFAAMDSKLDHKFNFNEAVSFMVHCKDQKEIDYYWEKLSADPNAEQCGWLKDKFGISWQIIPDKMAEMLQSDNPEGVKRVTEAFLKMKKFDLAKLEAAFSGK